MAVTARTPVIIGVGDVTNLSTRVEDAKEPMQLMLEAIRAAVENTGLPTERQNELRKGIDSIDVVATWSWPYCDLPGQIGDRLGVERLKHKRLSDHGGNSPGLMLHQAAARIADGHCDLSVVTGGEALASVALNQAGIKDPKGWTPRPAGQESLMEQLMAGSRRAQCESENYSLYFLFATSEANISPELPAAGTRHGITQAIHIYPMYENALRAHRGQTYHENILESAKLYSAFSEIATKNPRAWTYGKKPSSVDVLQEATGKNRMICTPYPLLMNAFNNVNMASACILTSTDIAEMLGVPKKLWVYPIGGAGFEESDDFWLRASYHHCPSIGKAIDTALSLAGLEHNDIEVLDVYSCFPIVPKLVCEHMGILIANPSRPITLLGGLTSFGGAGNNYSGNALVAMTRELRRGKKSNGLVLANGGFLTHEHAIVLSNKPPHGFGLPLNEAHHHVSTVGVPVFDEHAEGESVIETYTIEFDRKGHPVRGLIVGRTLKNQHRFLANHADESTLIQIARTTTEPIGRMGFVSTAADGRNLFTFSGSTSAL